MLRSGSGSIPTRRTTKSSLENANARLISKYLQFSCLMENEVHEDFCGFPLYPLLFSLCLLTIERLNLRWAEQQLCR